MRPRVFVSSTFYDLKYIREDLSNFIKAHDFDPILFEDGDVGYTPGKPIDNSCYESLRNSDMVVLIIGGQYGSSATGESRDDFKEYISVTRNEFKAALANGIPIYAFVDSRVYAEYGVYEQNYEQIEIQKVLLKFNATKNINIFRFIKEIRNIGNISITEFDKVLTIKEFLSKQWSDMFKKYLDLLRSEKEQNQLSSSVYDIKNLIEKMEIMIDGIGKTVMGTGKAASYDAIINAQKCIEIQGIAVNLCSSLRIWCHFNENLSFEKAKFIVRQYMLTVETLNNKMILSKKDKNFLMILSETFEEPCNSEGIGIAILQPEIFFRIEYVTMMNEKNMC